MTVSEIRHILESTYDRKVWKGFLQTQFTNNKLNAEDRVISLSDKTLSKQCLSLGNYEINEYTKIGIFEIELNEKVNITRNRVALRNLLKDLTKQVAGAMVVFVQGDKWRFSYISKRKVKNTATNEIQDKETAPKRYTYLFGKNEKALTAAIRFDKLIQKQQENIFQFLTLDDFEEAFSVEKLSKEFFKNYKEAYEDFVQFLTGKRYGKKGNKYVEQVIHEPDWQLTALFNKDEKQARDFCKRMMGRIVFLYFIQKKGWLAVAKGNQWGEGNPDYLYDLFTKSKHKEDFYHQELVPLFFRTLSNPDYEKANNDFRFPYLNGGLFDDSQDRKFNKLYMPERIFQNLFETFNNYNFTIYEDAPDEHTVAVDPEMLGHIFENLLEDNKDKGAFYTPKEIVHYMCKESLKAYLFAQDENYFGNNELAKQAIDKIIQQQELNDDEKQFAEKNAYKIIGALEQVKVCDPAIGSGAFPMGLLQEIFNALVYLQELKGFKKGVSDADIKKHIIEESIYGVDIDSGAVDIARLRFWLSLVVDEPEPQPLPNLDFKIICANTLIPLGKINELDMDAKASLAVKELEKIRHDFFNVSSEEKLQLERRFKKVQNDLLSWRELATKDNYEFYTKLYSFNPFDFQAAPCAWFDAWWMFGVKDGFDIIIGNPPYVSVKSISVKEKKLFTSIYKTAIGQFDLYGLFIEKAFDLLKQNSVFAMITSNTFLNNKDFYALRKKLILESSILSIANLDETIFESAQVDVSILIFKTSQPTDSKIKVFSNKINFLKGKFEFIPQSQFDNQSLNYELKLNCTKQDFEIIDVIFNNNIPLKDILDLPRGIELGSNSEIIETEQTSNNQKLLVGKDIKKYQINFDHRYIVFNELDKSTFKDLSIYHQPKLLIQRIRNLTLKERIIATLDQNNYLCTNTLRIGILKNSSYSLKYLLAVINSKLINYIFLKYFLNKDIYAYQLEQIPIVKVEKEYPFLNLVDYILLQKKQQLDSTLFERIIDAMVYELYFPDKIKKAGAEIIQHLNDLPELKKGNDEQNLKIIEQLQKEFSNPKNAISATLLKLLTIEEINIIEGRE